MHRDLKFLFLPPFSFQNIPVSFKNTKGFLSVLHPLHITPGFARPSPGPSPVMIQPVFYGNYKMFTPVADKRIIKAETEITLKMDGWP